MSISLEDLRANLAQKMKLFITGTATGGAVGSIIDTNGLAHLPEDDVLNNGLAYIREDAGGAGAAPEGEHRFISDFDQGTQTITLAANLTAAVAAGDTYEVYLTTLSLAQWDEAINAAIEAAWPEVWEPTIYEVDSFGGDEYPLPAAARDVRGIEVVFTGALAGYSAEPIPRAHWKLHGTPGTDLTVYLARPVPSLGRRLRVDYKQRYVELAAGESTDLDETYLNLAARAEVHATLAKASGQTDISRHSQMMVHYQGLAEARKAKLAQVLAGVPVMGEGKKK